MTRVDKFVRFSLIWGAASSCIILLLIQKGVRTSSVFALKDIPIYLGAVFFANKFLSKKGTRIAILLIFFELIYLFINYQLINPGYNSPINNIRQILAPLIVLLIFSHLKISEVGAYKMLKLLCWIILLVFGFGIFEQVIGLWPKFDLTTYFNLKGIPTDENGVSYMFYEPMFGYRERMTSTFLDPISVGHFFSSAGILLFYLEKKNKLQWAALLCCLAGLFFALSKGAIIQFFIGVILLNPKINWYIRLLLTSLPFIALSYLDSISGILIHISGFLNSLKSLSLFGYGIGSVGNYAKMFSTNLTVYSKLDISDTYVGALLGQIGVIGTLIWLIIGTLTVFYSRKKKAELIVATKIIISIFVVSVLSENTMNITSFLLPAVIAGIAMQLAGNHYKQLSILRENMLTEEAQA